jgi:Pyruvate/2-oxoglutarate dehydrogenase complex, dihydrolipoamide acyltransferase (E2) component, and related enzymes
VFGVDGSAAIINHPEVAILGIGRIIPRPWVVDGQVVPRQMTSSRSPSITGSATAGRPAASCASSPTA